MVISLQLKILLFVTGSFFTIGVYGNIADQDITLQFEQITSVQGLSNNTVFDITQDTEGFMWIGTREGLDKFDGQRITTYYENGTGNLPGNFIEQVLVTSGGRLIVGTQKGSCIYNKETDTFFPVLYAGESVGSIFKIIEISSGEVLISSDRGLFKADRSMNLSKISDLEFIDICEYRSGIIWGISGSEIMVFNLEGEIIRRYSNKMDVVGDLDMSSANIECLYTDSRGIMWIGTKRDGIGFYNQDTDRFYNLKLKEGVNPIEDNFIRVINEDMLGRLWIGTESGLFIYNVNSETFEFYGQCFIATEKGLNDKAIYSIFRSRDNLMWIGTYFGGINYTSLFQKGFNRIYADGGEVGLSGNAISEIIETRDNNLWIATEDGGICIYNPENKTFEYLKHNPGDPLSLSSNNVHALEEDKYGNIWIGTFIGGLNKYNRKLDRIEQVNLIPPAENMEEDVYTKSLFSILIDSKDRIWVGSIEGLYMRENENDDFRIWNPEFFQNNFVYQIDEDSLGNIWVATYEQGIFKVDREMEVSNYRTERNHDILSDRIVFSYVENLNTIWFGTVDGGLIKHDIINGSFKTFTEKDGLPNNTVYAITGDFAGHLWLSTNKGLSMFNISSEEFVNYTVNDGLIGNQFNFKSGVTTRDGTIFFGAVNGLTYFNPLQLRKDDRAPSVHFTDFRISNNSVKIGKDKILDKHINFQDKISLDYKNKVFTIDFVALDYLAPKKVQYAYYLDGLEKEWNYVGSNNNATYTNLSPGRYTFYLKASNGDQVWSDNIRQLSIRVLPPFWISVWGFILYGFILLSASFLIIRFYMIRQKEKMNVRLARIEKEKNEEISKHRLNFFTYISHEFKTPLTLIIATLEHIMNYEDILPKFKDYGILMRKNALRLLFLINQLMDFRKIETDHASIKFNRGDIVRFIKSTFLSFKPLMKKLSIAAKFKSNIDSYIVYFDADKIEKILTNLISNSCKSFKKPGTISLDVKIFERSHLANPSPDEEKSGELIITISDDGPGLPQEKLEQIYKPFESGDPSDFHSSGIGLSLVNSLVRYLNGQINFSAGNKGGTIIAIQLPLIHNPSPDLIKDESFIEKNTSFDIERTPFYIDTEEVILDFQDNGSVKTYELIIVEDNKELASFLHHHFAPIFRVQLAKDGVEAIEKIKKSQPDIVISDIMMPRMDGYTLCNTLKETIEFSHIPVILLTSKSGEDARIEGLFRGADVYIDKPFNLKELDLQVRNIIRSRENLRKHYATYGELNENTGVLSNRDQMFIRTLSETVHKHLDNGSFDVDTFCREVNMSRTLLHMKLKKITGLSTTEFIKSIRLNEAKKMIAENKLTIAEIAYRVGYNDPAYFSKSFKRFFGHVPSDAGSGVLNQN